MITHQGGKGNICPCILPKRIRTSLKPSWVVEIYGKTFQWHLVFVGRFCFWNTFEGAVALEGVKE
jgi:hypothetical protein